MKYRIYKTSLSCNWFYGCSINQDIIEVTILKSDILDVIKDLKYTEKFDIVKNKNNQETQNYLQESRLIVQLNNLDKFNELYPEYLV